MITIYATLVMPLLSYLWLQHLESKGILRGKWKKIVEKMERSSVDIYCLEETRLTGKLVRMISGKEAQTKLL